MSNLVFPKMRGEGWNTERTAQFNTSITETSSGIEYRTSKQAQPRYLFKIKYNFLKEHDTVFDEFKELQSFFISMNGIYETFLFRDQNNYSVFNGYVGTGDGSTKLFHIILNQKGFYERVNFLNLIGGFSVTINGIEIDDSQYSILETGELEFNTAPNLEDVIHASFEYYYRVRFNEDSLTLTEFLYKFHKGSLELITVLGENQ